MSFVIKILMKFNEIFDIESEGRTLYSSDATTMSRQMESSRESLIRKAGGVKWYHLSDPYNVQRKTEYAKKWAENRVAMRVKAYISTQRSMYEQTYSNRSMSETFVYLPTSLTQAWSNHQNYSLDDDAQPLLLDGEKRMPVYDA